MNLPRNPLPLGLALGLAMGVLAGRAPAADAVQPLPVAAAATAQALPGDSLYHLQAALTDQHGHALQWADLRGRPQLVSMFYANCHLMCPLILENAKALQKQLPAADSGRLGVSMFTLDTERDTPGSMAEVSELHR
jgi:protein SCO1/2